MKKLLLESIALAVLIAGPATAADLAVKAPRYKAVVISDPWIGFYAGLNVGYSWGDWSASSNQWVFNFQSLTARPKVNGWLGGVQAGFNWRGSGPWLWGVETDIQVTGEKTSETWTHPELPPNPPTPAPPPSLDVFVLRAGGPALLSHDWKLPWFGTLRLRVGVTPAQNWLFYVTGGLAYGESKYSFSFSQPGAAANFFPTPTTYAFSNTTTRAGFAVGFGSEAKVSKNWSVRLEYLYVDLGKASIDTRDIDGGAFHVDYWIRDHIVRAGVNYKFD